MRKRKTVLGLDPKKELRNTLTTALAEIEDKYCVEALNISESNFLEMVSELTRPVLLALSSAGLIFEHNRVDHLFSLEREQYLRWREASDFSPTFAKSLMLRNIALIVYDVVTGYHFIV